MLTFAVPKGRMMDQTIECLRNSGITIPEAEKIDRELIFYDEDKKYKFVIVKPSDVTTYVEYGAAEVGVSGKDIIEETEANIYEPLDLGFSECRLSVACLDEEDPDIRHPRVATEFPNLAERHFAQKGENVEIITLHGSVELAPLIGLAQRIVDIVSTGRTLRQNGLVEEETILESSARLIVNRPAMKLHREEIDELIDRLQSEVSYASTY
ncbi:MAG: ATP phosphoribosyltransferase [bacterium]